MDINFNIPPANKILPPMFNGKKPLDVEHAVIEEGAKEPSYKVLCKGGTYEIIPLSAFIDKPKEEKTDA